jgi:hypothetical protein
VNGLVIRVHESGGVLNFSGKRFAFGGLRSALLLHFQYPFIVGLLHFPGSKRHSLNMLFLTSTVLWGDGRERFCTSKGMDAYTVVFMNATTGHISCWLEVFVGTVHELYELNITSEHD